VPDYDPELPNCTSYDEMRKSWGKYMIGFSSVARILGLLCKSLPMGLVVPTSPIATCYTIVISRLRVQIKQFISIFLPVLANTLWNFVRSWKIIKRWHVRMSGQKDLCYSGLISLWFWNHNKSSVNSITKVAVAIHLIHIKYYFASVSWYALQF
jgi:hypothetical protein